MAEMNNFLVNVATDANFARRFRENPLAVVAGARLSNIEESILLSRDAKQIQSSLHAVALKQSLNSAADDTVWTVIIIL